MNAFDFVIKKESELKQSIPLVLDRVISNKKKNSAMVVALEGEMGVGKTTTAQYIAKTIGVSDTVISPTFVLMRQYAVTEKNHNYPEINYLYHIDWYRIDTVEELKTLRFKEIWSQSDALVLIEWADKYVEQLPEYYTKIIINLNSDDVRHFRVIY